MTPYYRLITFPENDGYREECRRLGALSRRDFHRELTEKGWPWDIEVRVREMRSDARMVARVVDPTSFQNNRTVQHVTRYVAYGIGSVGAVGAVALLLLTVLTMW